MKDENVAKVMKDVGTSTGKTKKEMSGFGETMKSLGGTMAMMNQGLELMKKGYTALVGPVKAAVDAYAEFEKAVLEVNSLAVDNIAAVETVTNATLELSKQFGADAVGQVKAYYQAVSGGAGIGIEATETLRQGNILALAGVADLGVATTGLIAVQNAYGLSTENLSDINNNFFVAVKQGITTISLLMPRISGYTLLRSSVDPPAQRSCSSQSVN